MLFFHHTKSVRYKPHMGYLHSVIYYILNKPSYYLQLPVLFIAPPTPDPPPPPPPPPHTHTPVHAYWNNENPQAFTMTWKLNK